MLKSGETGIRTPGTSQYNGFQDRRNRPLCHLSKRGCKYKGKFKYTKERIYFFSKISPNKYNLITNNNNTAVNSNP